MKKMVYLKTLIPLCISVIQLDQSISYEIKNRGEDHKLEIRPFKKIIRSLIGQFEFSLIMKEISEHQSDPFEYFIRCLEIISV